MFTGAVLLVALMIFNDQKSECVTQETGRPDIEHIELLAEVCSNQLASSSVPSHWRYSGVIIEAISGKFNSIKYLNSVEHLIRFNTQMQIHLELKPDLDFQTGQNLHHYSGYEDPPVA